MKLVRFGETGTEKPGVLIDGKRYDVSSYFTDWNSHFFQNNGLKKLQELISEKKHSLIEVPSNVRWGACVARPWKVICIGLNYSDHAKESGMPIPIEPIIFMKASNTVVGPFDDVKIPRGSQKTDWEVELGIVIGKEARYLNSIEDAVAHIAGYCISHDVSERYFQLERGGQWTKGKSCDTFNPIGPWMATCDEIKDINNLKMNLLVNGEVKQNGSTSTMIFDVKYIVHYLSQFMTLEAGDIISTGTPPGVGFGQKPPQYLKAGDVVELSIEGLGTQKQKFINA
ncbi:MAG: fumarylacetoacetate hydrolase family protein [Bacteroidota bacterium]|nr:fumarylacetoacetate hydrolase family protein [Bacteroidota bacterium]